MQLHAKEQEFSALDAKLVVVGNGAAHYIDGFKESSGFTGTIVTDPQRELFGMLGLKTSKSAVLRPNVLMNGIKAFAAGHRQQGVKGDPWQQGGILVVDADLSIQFLHRYESAGESIPWDEMWSAVKSI